MNIGLLVFLVSVAGMIGLVVYAFVVDPRREAAAQAKENERTRTALATMHQALYPSFGTSTFGLPATFARSQFVSFVHGSTDVTGLVAVTISDTWREQIEPRDLARFMHENPGSILKHEQAEVVLYVPDEDIATMARLAL